MEISEIFKSIQGEGKYIGVPMLFIRTYGCTRNRETCPFKCDTLYAVKSNHYKEMTANQLVRVINKSRLDYICFTGGEPLLQRNEIKEVIRKIPEKKYCLETNGDILLSEDFFTFDYLSISPKDKKTCLKIKEIIESQGFSTGYDIKIVTDLEKVGVDMLEFATTLMPLTTFTEKDKEIAQKVWEYCVKHKKRFSPRLQIYIWGKRKGK